MMRSLVSWLPSILMTAFAVLLGSGGGGAAAPASAQVTPGELQCEYLTDPLGIDVETPRFSWKLRAEAGVRGQKQTGYQVLVASEPAILKQDRADLWDSGRVSSSQSTLVSYGGPPLVSNQDCYWKVRVLDRDGRLSAWSPVARFSMGLLAPQDWKGAWIKHPSAPPEKHLWFRKNLSLDGGVRRAFIHVASVGYHELYANGQKVDDRVLAPALTRLDRRVLYVTYDVTALLKPGTNVIALWTGPGWARYDFFRLQPALRVQLEGVLDDGRALSVASDDTWRTEISSSQNAGQNRWGNNGGEMIDARRHVPGWNEAGFDDRAWLPAATTSAAATLSAHMMPPTRIIETIKAERVIQQGTTNLSPYKVVLARNFAGWLEIKMHGLSAGDRVTIRVADDAKTVEDFNQRSEYVASGQPGEVFRNRFNYSAGRYVTIEGLRQKPGLNDVTGLAVGTDLKRTGHFSCSKELFNRIYETDLWTYCANTTEGFTADCPHRERMGYGEVVFATSWGIGLPNYEAGAFYLKHIRDWTDVQEASGWIHHTAPQTNRHYGGPMWSSAGLNLSWEHYQMFGDRRALELIYPSAKRWLEFCHSKTTNGLLCNYSEHWGKFLGDWAAPGQRKERGDSREAQYFNNCVYAMNLATVVQMAQVLGKEPDAAFYSHRLEDLKPRVHREFFNATNDTYCGGTQVQQAFALLVGIAPEELRPRIAARLKQEFVDKEYFDMGSSGLPVLLKHLVEQSADPGLAFGPLARTNEPSYGHFLARGESTWPEYWNVDVPSRIHTCYTGIAGWFTKSLAGIRPDPAHPGFQSFLIRPVLAGDITHADATIESPYGPIRSRWEKARGRLTLKVTIPPGAVATVHVPTRDASRVTEGGRAVARAVGVAPLGTEGGCAVFKVESGEYSFSAKL